MSFIKRIESLDGDKLCLVRNTININRSFHVFALLINYYKYKESLIILL